MTATEMWTGPTCSEPLRPRRPVGPLAQGLGLPPDPLDDLREQRDRMTREAFEAMGISTAGLKAEPVSILPTPTPTPTTDPLDVEYDGVKLRDLLDMDADARHEGWAGTRSRRHVTPAQRAAVSTHWLAQLRARIDDAAARERNRVVVDQEDE